MAKKKVKKDKIPALIIIGLVLLTILSSFKNFYPLTMKVVEIQGFKRVFVDLELEEERGIVKLYSDCHELRMEISKEQAVSIINGENKIRYFRPLTHDLMSDIIEGYGIKVLMVKIVDIKNNTYFADLVLRYGNKILSLDSRPSDALAIAARTDYLVPVYVKEEILEKYGIKTC